MEEEERGGRAQTGSLPSGPPEPHLEARASLLQHLPLARTGCSCLTKTSTIQAPGPPRLRRHLPLAWAMRLVPTSEASGAAPDEVTRETLSTSPVGTQGPIGEHG